MADVVIREWLDEKGWIHRVEIPLLTFLREHDFESVVRCKDCRFRQGEKEGFCYGIERYVSDDDYCSRGERVEDGEE